MRSEVKVNNKILMILIDPIMKNQFLVVVVSWLRYTSRNVNISV